MTDQNEAEILETLLPIYYQRFFPFALFHKWLRYGDVKKTYFTNREFSFTLQGDVYLRYQSFSTADEFKKKILENRPVKIDIGAVYSARPKDHKTVLGFQPLEKELIFDIDMTDYDDVRFCCSGADICPKCWPLMIIAVKILDRSMREDFGFRFILWVYSGRRGIHCWVCDEKARRLTKNVRQSMVDFLSVLIGGDRQAKKVNLTYPVHPSIRNALEVVRQDFDAYAIEKQDFLGSQEKLEKVLRMVKDEKLAAEIRNECKRYNETAERWQLIQNVVSKVNMKNLAVKKNFTIEEIMLQFCYPRLDAHVTIGVNHLLKSPFCVHPKTGRVCVPFLASHVTSFNPFEVPTLSQLIDEINQFEAKSESLENEQKNTDYKKTSLNQYIKIFESFLDDLSAESQEKRLEQSDQKMEF